MISETSSSGYAGCCEVLASTDLLPQLAAIGCPVRVVVGLHDPSTPPVRGEEIVAAIAQADLVSLDAAHISPVGAPEGFANAVRDFLPLIERKL
jgi:pimeloyl-ACP methyl ester carboxylesterase